MLYVNADEEGMGRLVVPSAVVVDRLEVEVWAGGSE